MTALSARLGPASHLALLLWALAMVALLPESSLWPVLPALLALGWLMGRAGLTVLARGRFWLLLLFIVALAALFVEEPDIRWGPLGLSWAGIRAGLAMALRAAILVLAFSVSLGSLSVGQLTQLFEGLRSPGVGLALGVALNLGPVLQDTVEAAYHTLRLRGGFRRPSQALRLFLVTVIANALRYGDDVVNAAAARAFDPAAAPPGRQLALGGADRLFIAALVASGAALLASSHLGI